MARRQHNNSISLFPFLAVLVCTMGSLILLLLVTTRQIRNEQQADYLQQREVVSRDSPAPVTAENSSSDADEEPAKDPLPNFVTLIEEADREIAELTEVLGNTNSLIKVKTEENQTTEQAIAQLKANAESVEKELDLLKASQPPSNLVSLMQETADLQARRSQLEARIDDTTQQLQKKRSQLAALNELAKETAVQLYEQKSALLNLRKQVQVKQSQPIVSSGTKTQIEFSNSTGTTRTPVIVDVSNTGYEFLPTGIRITARDMEGFPVRDNPLLSGILTIHRQRCGSSVTSEPYVLLLVRPDGSIPFYGAQRILAEAGIHFGYELLESDRVVAAGARDEVEVKLVRDALLEALNRRETLYAMVNRQREDLIEGLEKQPPDERRLVVRSDGRVITGEDAARRPLEGRYYAGGEAPPKSLYKPQPLRRPGLPEDRRFAPPALAGKTSPNKTDSTSDSPNSVLPRHRLGAADNKKSQTAAEAATQSAAETEAELIAAFNEAMLQNSSKLQASATSRQTNPHSVTTEINPPADTQSVFADAQSVSADTQGMPSTSTQGMTSNQTQGIASNNTQALMSGDTLTASNNQREPGSAEFGEKQEQRTEAGFPVMMPEGGSTSGKPVDMTRIDPDLLRLLKTKESLRREMSTPVGITVFLDAEHMTIGQKSAVRVDPDHLDPALAQLLMGISEEVAASRREPHEPLLPIVKFIVSPGGERLRIPLARELKQIGIPSASVIEITPWVVPVDDSGRAFIDDTSAPSALNDPSYETAPYQYAALPFEAEDMQSEDPAAQSSGANQ